MPEPAPRRMDLETRIYELIVDFPDRLDEMEVRSEENCRLLAARIARIVEEEIRKRIGRA